MRVLCLVNPYARRLRRGRLVAEDVQSILGRAGEVVITKDLDHLAEVLATRLTPDLACIVTVGGDGALHWALNVAAPIARARSLELPPFLPARSGTIDFVARKVGLRGNPAEILARLARAVRAERPIAVRTLPSVRITLELRDGGTMSPIAFAAALAGIGARFFDQYYAHPDPSPATIVSVIARAVAEYPFGGRHARELFRPQRARVVVDGFHVPGDVHSGVHVGAIDLDLGGVLRVFPRARDGALHLQAGRLEPTAIIASLPALATGGPVRGENFLDQAGCSMDVEALGDEPLRPVIDGERYPDAVRVRVERGPGVRVAVV